MLRWRPVRADVGGRREGDMGGRWVIVDVVSERKRLSLFVVT